MKGKMGTAEGKVTPVVDQNKGFQAYYSSLYEVQAQLYQESKPLREPSKKCRKL